MHKNSKMRILTLRHIWIVVLAMVLTCVGFTYAFLRPEAFADEERKMVALYVFFGFFYLFVLGAFMVIFFPKQKDSIYFGSGIKIIFIGFFLASLSVPAEVIFASKTLVPYLKYTGLGIVVIGYVNMFLKNR